MKKNIKTRLIKEFHTLPHNLLLISLSLLLFSCQKKKYPWQPGISAPRYYPVAGTVDFGNAGNGSNTSFANGWGDQYGSVVSGDQLKEVPKQVYIDYYSVVDGKGFRGKVVLPHDRILELFKQYNVRQDYWAHLVVGMAPGGWIRIWFTTIDAQIEVAKAQLKAYKDDTVGEGLKNKTYKEWGSTYTYWQHHGIPYSAWANNEKEYDIIFDFNKPNPKNQVTDPEYSSLDGTSYFRTPIGSLLKRKLPADLVAVWKSKNSNVYYDTHVTFPKNFSKIIEDRKLNKFILSLQIEEDDQHGIFYLIGNNKKEKLLRFKNYLSKSKTLGDSDFSKEVEYFIQ